MEIYLEIMDAETWSIVQLLITFYAEIRRLLTFTSIFLTRLVSSDKSNTWD